MRPASFRPICRETRGADFGRINGAVFTSLRCDRKWAYGLFLALDVDRYPLPNGAHPELKPLAKPFP